MMTGESSAGPLAVTLVLGGARSGKSRFAESLAASAGAAKVYLATGEALDHEMSARIARHRAERAAAMWETIEEPIRLPEVIAAEARPGRVILVDCLTLWLSNLMLAERDVAAAGMELVSALGAAACPLVLVSNEVGMGLVPENALARAFRDEQGRLNQRIAEVVPNVVFVAAGLPLVLKGAAAA
jgi:adenosylcobinamide kinase/adenosylcobinamide-phosphate guanylyltransferase